MQEETPQASYFLRFKGREQSLNTYWSLDLLEQYPSDNTNMSALSLHGKTFPSVSTLLSESYIGAIFLNTLKTGYKCFCH